MNEPTFDIFRGTTDKDAMWVEAVDGLSVARARMEAIAATKPGAYFVFSPSNHAVLARIDTRKNLHTSARKKMAGAA
jgi:hypothetical protein